MAPVTGKSDGFTQMFHSLQFNLKDLISKSDEIKAEKNKAAVATANAEIRRGKNFLRGELPKLRKMMDKKMKGLTDEEKDERVSQVDNFEYQIECVPDGVNKAPPAPPKPRAGGDGGTGSTGGNGNGKRHVTINMEDLEKGQGVSMEHSKDSRAFRDEFEEAKQRQDQGLDEISKGLSVLKNLGGEMDDEIKRQTPILDVIDEKLDSTTAEMRTANGKLKKVITSMRSTRNFLRGRHPHLHHPRHRHVLHEQLRLMNM
jgi:SYP7 family syntaxin